MNNARRSARITAPVATNLLDMNGTPQSGHLPRPMRTLNPGCMSLPHPSHIGGHGYSSTISDAFDTGLVPLWVAKLQNTVVHWNSPRARLVGLSPCHPDRTALRTHGSPPVPFELYARDDFIQG